MANGGVIGRDNRPSVYSAAGVWGVNEAYHARLSNNWPGEVLTHVGSFVGRGSVGTQAITGVGFTPKAIIFFTAGAAEASGTWGPDVLQTIGFTAGPSSSYSVGGLSLDGVGTSDTSRRMAAKAFTLPTTAGSGVFEEAALQSFDADGFTLDWTVVTGAGGGVVICYFALGGDIEAEVLNWTKPTSGTKSVTGVGFQPDLVFHASYGDPTPLPLSAANHIVAFGAMNSAGEQWALGLWSLDGTSGSDTQRVQRTDRCFVMTSEVPAINHALSYLSMDADGFSVTNETGTQAHQIASLCIKGVKSKLGAFNKSTSAGPVVDQVTAPDFSPAAWLTAAYGTTSSTSPIATSIMAMGATDGTNQRAATLIDLDAVSTTQADSIWYSGSGLAIPSSGPTTNSLASIALTAVGADYTWNPNNAAAYEILYAAIGTP